MHGQGEDYVGHSTLRWGNVICRDHAQVCTISATAGSLPPLVPWDGEDRVCGAGRPHRHLLKNFCQWHPSPLRRALEPAAAPPPKDAYLAAPQKDLLLDEKCIQPGCPDKSREAFLGGSDRSSETEGKQAVPPTPGDATAAAAFPCPLFLLLAVAAAVKTLYGVAVWTALRSDATVLLPARTALSIGCAIEKYPCQWVPFSICMCCMRFVCSYV
ncbi:hypothetical protein MOQ_006519 [Trypanosoma cruzi marinkellei]|uniref:Uncharacterized protein n=1 Tax=Trypanosoma cruzi marinkellei TaxID=85056 RepID=K2M3Y4_TRYCR|nr:hypothetical protein MOQ_006519 [Trypanosoma cruzi marinkellei]